MSLFVNRSIRSSGSSSRSYVLYLFVAVLVTLMIATSPSCVSASDDVKCEATSGVQDCEAKMKPKSKLTIKCNTTTWNHQSPDKGSLCKVLMSPAHSDCNSHDTLAKVIPGATETGDLANGWIIQFPDKAPKKDIVFSYLCKSTEQKYMRVNGKFEGSDGSAGFNLSTGNLPFIVSGAVAIVFAIMSY